MASFALLVGLLVLLLVIHRQAAMRMLVVEPGAQERGVLDIAEEARPAFVVTEILAVAVAVALAARWSAAGAVVGGVLAVVLLVTGLLVPIPAASGGVGPAPLVVRALAGLRPRPHLRGARSEPVHVEDPLDEGRLTRRMLRFQEQAIDEVMVPRRDVIGLEQSDDVTRLLELVEEHRHSRYPVFDEDIDRVVGYLSVFDLSRLERGTSSFASIVRSVLAVPEGKRCTELLTEMLAETREFALVVDEFGGTAGIVTIEDLVEELVGEIWDEHEKAAVMLQRVGRNVYVSRATIPLADLSDRLQLEFPEGDYETLAGFLLDVFERIPARGETVPWGGYVFEVLRADRRRIESVQITHVGGGGRA